MDISINCINCFDVALPLGIVCRNQCAYDVGVRLCDGNKFLLFPFSRTPTSYFESFPIDQKVGGRHLVRSDSK